MRLERQPLMPPLRASAQLSRVGLRRALLRHIRALKRAAHLHLHADSVPVGLDAGTWRRAVQCYKAVLFQLRVRLQTCSDSAVERLAVEVHLVSQVVESVRARYDLLV